MLPQHYKFGAFYLFGGRMKLLLIILLFACGDEQDTSVEIDSGTEAEEDQHTYGCVLSN